MFKGQKREELRNIAKIIMEKFKMREEINVKKEDAEAKNNLIKHLNRFRSSR